MYQINDTFVVNIQLSSNWVRYQLHQKHAISIKVTSVNQRKINPMNSVSAVRFMVTSDKPLYEGSLTSNIQGISDFATMNFYFQHIKLKDVPKPASNQHLCCSNKSVQHFCSTPYTTRQAKPAIVTIHVQKNFITKLSFTCRYDISINLSGYSMKRQ